jgi:glutathione synthase/RimK-type ligase-like ATP-grasp enzyme
MPPSKFHFAVAMSFTTPPASDQTLLDTLNQDPSISATPVIWSDPTLDWQKFDAILVRSCWDYFLRIDEFSSWLEYLNQLSIPVINPLPLIRWNMDKRYLRDMHNIGIAIPPSIWVQDDEILEIADVCRQQGWAKLVAKPLISGGAHQTWCAKEGSVKGPYLLQEYLSNIESAGEWSLIYFGSEYSHAILKKPAAGDFRVQSQFGGQCTLAEPTPEMQSFARSVLRAQYQLCPHAPTFARVDMLADAHPQPSAPFVLMELEVIEPELFLPYANNSNQRATTAILRQWHTLQTQV